jgi:hypothetical protein
MVKELVQKDHKDAFSETVKFPQRKIADILRHTLEHFGQTHTKEDIDDLNRLLAWVLYSNRPLTLAELNAATGVESSQGEFLDIRDKIERDFSAYFTIIDISQKTKDYIKQEALRSREAEILKARDETIFSDDGASVAQHNDLDATGSSSDVEMATVKLSHSSVARFFRSSDKIEISEKSTFIGVSRVDAHLRLAKACLKLICSTKEYLSLLEYAAYSFHKHLGELDGDNISKADKVEVAQYLLRIFRNNDALSRWLFFAPANFWPDWYQTTGPFGICWKVLSDEEVQQDLLQEDVAWATDTGVSRTEKLLKPIATFLAQKWLQEVNSGWLVIGCWYHLHSLIKLVCVTPLLSF